MANIPVWPESLEPNEAEFWPQWHTKTFQSPFTRAAQVLEYPGCVWKAQLSFRNLTRTQQKTMEIFLLQLRGAANRVKIGDPVFNEPSGAGAGKPVVDGDRQTGSVLRVIGCEPEKLFLVTGDYFTVNDELKRLIADARSDIDGRADLYFEPPLRQAPANSAPVVVRQAYCLMRLDNDDQLRSKRKPMFGSLTLNFTEALF
ncbi:hypothetical protein NX722_05595 [Endozoicomonas gorgoniicola]|uniref:Uncharacterized protein n=1 Tax=Endozoicomonas gorgoniicola TaxID=1234144 RepID=A0ABT3MRX4_9GAMM|nr:hypothetical protein [Endozoicomonas gorgoniicola]MCW7552126.1 hypothetical protein [Endozoicomonas gorgoniicola]